MRGLVHWQRGHKSLQIPALAPPAGRYSMGGGSALFIPNAAYGRNQMVLLEGRAAVASVSSWALGLEGRAAVASVSSWALGLEGRAPSRP